MYKGRRVLALIPARGGSKRLPGNVDGYKAKMGSERMLNPENGAAQIPKENAFDRSHTQDQGWRFLLNGALHVFPRKNVLDSEKYAWGSMTRALKVEKTYDADIDVLTDFRIANAIAHEFDFNC